MAEIKGLGLGGMITPGGNDANTFPTHEDIYGKGGYMVVAKRTGISTERVKKGMLVYDSFDEKIYKCIDATKSSQAAGWEELKTTYDGGGKYLGAVSAVGGIKSDADIKAGDFYRASVGGFKYNNEDVHAGDIIMATADGGTSFDVLHTEQQTLVSVKPNSDTGYVTGISASGNEITVTKATNIKVSNATNADTASVANKLVGSVEEIRANAKFSESSTVNDAYDTTLLDPGKIQLLHNYKAYSNWLYAPSTMGYGHVLNIGCNLETANAQFAWDTSNTAGKTGNLYWRFFDNYNDTRKAYLKDSSINCNWKQVVTSDMLRSNIFQSAQSSYTGTKTGSCFRAGYNNYTATRTSENGYTKFSNISLNNENDSNKEEFAIYASCKSSVLHDGTSPITVSFVVKCNKPFSPNDTTTKKARFYCSQASKYEKLVEIKANTDTRITATFRFLQVPTDNFYLAFYIPDVSSDTVLQIKELMVQIGSTATPWTPALEDYLDLSTMNALNANNATYATYLGSSSNKVGVNDVALKADLSKYLPLTGGTLTGKVDINVTSAPYSGFDTTFNIASQRAFTIGENGQTTTYRTSFTRTAIQTYSYKSSTDATINAQTLFINPIGGRVDFGLGDSYGQILGHRNYASGTSYYPIVGVAKTTGYTGANVGDLVFGNNDEPTTIRSSSNLRLQPTSGKTAQVGPDDTNTNLTMTSGSSPQITIGPSIIKYNKSTGCLEIQG